jgi:hypothetical protein
MGIVLLNLFTVAYLEWYTWTSVNLEPASQSGRAFPMLSDAASYQAVMTLSALIPVRDLLSYLYLVSCLALCRWSYDAGLCWALRSLNATLPFWSLFSYFSQRVVLFNIQTEYAYIFLRVLCSSSSVSFLFTFIFLKGQTFSSPFYVLNAW